MAEAAAELLANGAAHRAAQLGAILRRHGGPLAAVQALEECVPGAVV
ncbi:MAG TPA: hypothetical protein VGX23_32845 [Actinocrinis sp.]|nr:hypothetical protein [Actinocrinis sp.]